jgi:uroporphyrinogen-III synthase
VRSPLAGLRIAVTRPRDQAEELAAPLRAHGAEVVTTPLIRIVPEYERPDVRAALERIGEYDWIVVTSANGVDMLMAALTAFGLHLPDHAAVACVGPATASALRAHGHEPAAMPEAFVGDRLAEHLIARGAARDRRILLARARGGRDVLPDRLKAAGALVEEAELYYSSADEAGATQLRAEIAGKRVNLLTFTSGSTVRYFRQLVGEPGAARIAVIGPVTAEVARASGFGVTIEAEPHTVEGLVGAIVRYYEETH